MKKAWDLAAVAGSRILRQGVLIVLMAIAARVLGKELVGVWALIYVVIQFGVLLADSGISTFIIRERELHGRLYSSAFYLSLGLAVCVSALTAAIAIPLIGLLEHGEYWREMMAGAGAIVPLGISGVLQSKLRREKRFGILLVSDAIGSGLVLIVASWLLLHGFQVWAFVASTIVGAVTTTLVCLWATELPRFQFDREDVRKIIGYSSGLLGFSSINFWSRNADSVLVGKYLGATQLGIYSVAYRIMMLPLSQVNAIALTVALPYLSPLQDDLPRLRRAMRQLFVAIGMVTTVPMLLIWLERDSLVHLFLGPGWERVAELTFVLAPLGLLQSLVNPTGMCFLVSGRTRLFFVVGLISTAVTLASFVIGVYLGSIDAVVISFAIANLLVLPITVEVGMRTIGGSLLDWLRCALPFLVVAPVAWLLAEAIPMPTSTLAHWGVSTVIVLAAALLSFRLFLRSDIDELFQMWRRPLQGTAKRSVEQLAVDADC